jgi:hypothetical protein
VDLFQKEVLMNFKKDWEWRGASDDGLEVLKASDDGLVVLEALVEATEDVEEEDPIIDRGPPVS